MPRHGSQLLGSQSTAEHAASPGRPHPLEVAKLAAHATGAIEDVEPGVADLSDGLEAGNVRESSESSQTSQEDSALDEGSREVDEKAAEGSEPPIEVVEIDDEDTHTAQASRDSSTITVMPRGYDRSEQVIETEVVEVEDEHEDAHTIQSSREGSTITVVSVRASSIKQENDFKTKFEEMKSVKTQPDNEIKPESDDETKPEQDVKVKTREEDERTSKRKIKIEEEGELQTTRKQEWQDSRRSKRRRTRQEQD
jgi:hypothetical protein